MDFGVVSPEFKQSGRMHATAPSDPSMRFLHQEVNELLSDLDD